MDPNMMRAKAIMTMRPMAVATTGPMAMMILAMKVGKPATREGSSMYNIIIAFTAT